MTSELLTNSSESLNCLFSDDSQKITFNKKPCLLNLNISKFIVSYVTQENVTEIDCKSIVGARSSKDKTGFVLIITSYDTPTGCCCCCSTAAESMDRIRKRMTLTLKFSLDDGQRCENWKNALNTIATTPWGDAASLQFATAASEEGPGRRNVLPPATRKILVFVNPVGGTKIAMNVWSDQVKPVLEDANIDIELVVTTHSNHARDVVTSCVDLTTYTAIMPVGGDGLIFEVVNGITSREDGADMIQRVALAPIAGGTSNGLVKSILFENREQYNPVNSSFLAVRGSPHPLDLCEVTTCDEKCYSAFLILGWGIISDIDILSETMRFLGEARLYVAAVYFLVKKQYYRGRLQLKLVDAQHTHKSSSMLSVSGLEPAINPLAAAQGADLQTKKGPNEMDKVLIDESAGIDTDTSSNESKANGWLTIEGDFLMVWVVQTSHASSSMLSGPGVTLNDGVLTVFVVQHLKRHQLAQLLLEIDDGGHVNHPCVQTYKCTEYVLEPLTEKGLFSLDGEVVTYGKISGVVKPGAAKVMKLF